MRALGFTTVRQRRGRQRGQSLVQFALSSILLLLLMMGLLHLGRAFYTEVSLRGAAGEGARHAAWSTPASRANISLDAADILSAVNGALSGGGLTGALGAGAGCLPPPDGTSQNTRPYAQTVSPAT